MIHIGISASYRLYGGSIVSLREFLPRWSAAVRAGEIRVTLYTLAENLDLLRGALDDSIRVRTLPKWRLLPPAHRMIWEQLRFPAMLRRDGVDVLFSSANVMPAAGRVPSVVMFHNAAPFCRDLTRDILGWSYWVKFRLMRIMMLVAARRATKVIFLSRFFRDLLQRQHGFPPERGTVIYNGREPSEDDASVRIPELPRPYLAFVSHLYPYKHLEPLLEGFAAARRDPARARDTLVVVGSAWDRAYFGRLQALVARLNLRDHVVFTGSLPPAGVRQVVTGAEVFVFQSLCENCPNALIEALALGVPVISSRAAAMPEIAGDAAEYFDPRSASDIGRAITTVMNDPERRRDLRERAVRRAAELPGWDEVARQTLDTLVAAARTPSLEARHG